MPDFAPPALADLPRIHPEAVGLDPRALERLVSVMQREIDSGKVPGATLAIGRHGKIGFAAALGARKPEGPAMPLDAIFRIYSMTKPVVTIAAMQLVEEGRLFLSDPIQQYIPAFADTKVGIERGDELDLVAPTRPITVQDLMRHTSGLTYGFTGVSQAQRLLRRSGALSQQRDSAGHMETIAALPLQHQPGKVWEYSVSTDVLGRIVEVIEGAPLSVVLQERILGPLGMTDTAFYTPPDKLERRAEPVSLQMFSTIGIDPNNMTAPPKFEMGGGGLLGTLGDYLRFLAMLDGGGVLQGKRILGPRTLAFMTSNHLSPHVRNNHPLLPPGNAFGLGFAVRTDAGLAPTAGSVGEYFWGGVAGTAFFVSPADSLYAVLMLQAPEYRDYFRLLFRTLVYAAVV